MTPATRRSVFGLGASLALVSAASARAAPIASDLDGFRMGTIGCKVWPPEDGKTTYPNFTYAVGMYPECKTFDGWICSPFARGEHFIKQYDDTYLAGQLFCDIHLGGPRCVKMGIWLTLPGTTTPLNMASEGMPGGVPGDDITFTISWRHICRGPAGRYGAQVYVMAFEPTDFIFDGACGMLIEEIRLPRMQT
jgi:hypothetical protein